LAIKTKFVAQEGGGRRLVIFFPQNNGAGEEVRKEKRQYELDEIL